MELHYADDARGDHSTAGISSLEKADEAISDLHMSGGLLNKRQSAEFVTRLLLSVGAYWDSDASPHARQLLYDNDRYYDVYPCWTILCVGDLRFYRMKFDPTV